MSTPERIHVPIEENGAMANWYNRAKIFNLPAIEYVRFDLYDQLHVEVEKLRELQVKAEGMMFAVWNPTLTMVDTLQMLGCLISELTRLREKAEKLREQELDDLLIALYSKLPPRLTHRIRLMVKEHFDSYQKED